MKKEYHIHPSRAGYKKKLTPPVLDGVEYGWVSDTLDLHPAIPDSMRGIEYENLNPEQLAHLAEALAADDPTAPPEDNQMSRRLALLIKTALE